MISIIDSRANIRRLYHDSLRAMGFITMVFVSPFTFVSTGAAFQTDLLILGSLIPCNDMIEPIEWLATVEPDKPTFLMGHVGSGTVPLGVALLFLISNEGVHRVADIGEPGVRGAQYRQTPNR
jgi:hypothetical protein